MKLNRLSVSDLEIIKAHKLVLLDAQKIGGVPWQMLAALWYRERSLTIGNNPFQFDPPPTHAKIVGLLQSYTDYKPTSYSIDDFHFAAILAACYLRSTCRYALWKIESFQNPFPENLSQEELEGYVSASTQVITTDSSDKAIADAFYGYNGRAYGSNPLNSPYVANELDELHHNMHFRGESNGQWIDIIDERPGAFVVYKQLLQVGI